MLEKKMKFKSGKVGSALIMTIVLTVLLSIVAVTFVLVARMDIAATSNISDSKSLDNAAKSIIEIIGRELVFDTPGVALKKGLSQSQYPQYYDYQDYPDVNDAWLANIEPETTDGVNYYWRQISDVNGYLGGNYGRQSVENIQVKPENIPYNPDVVREYSEIGTDNNGKLEETSADADGDGIADSKWIELSGINSSKGKKVYAAVRVIDNCAMINVNTAYKFDADTLAVGDRYKVDGTSQMQINLILKDQNEIPLENFHKARGGIVPDSETSWNNYDNGVIWKYDSVPGGSYLPFDISDELELRYRYCIDSKFKSRTEDILIDNTLYRGGSFPPDYGLLYNNTSDADWNLNAWQSRVTDINSTGYGDRRHLLTTYNFDRVIAPDGEKMFNILSPGISAQGLYNRLRSCVDLSYPTIPEADMHAYLAQFAANVVDHGDNDSNVSVVVDKNGKKFFGMEQPYIYISEITRNFKTGPAPGDMNVPPKNVVFRSYAIELYKEDVNDTFDDWELRINKPDGTIDERIPIKSSDFDDRGGQYYVIVFENAKAPLADQVKYSDSPKDGAKNVNPKVMLMWDKFLMGYDPISGNQINGNPILSDSYDVYCGTDKIGVTDANKPPPAGGGYYYQHVSDIGFRIPKKGFTSNTTYYWKVVGKKTGFGDVKSPVYSFTTWTTEPNDVYNKKIQAGEFIFDNNTTIVLSRHVLAIDVNIIVDRVPSDFFVNPQAELLDWLTDESAENMGVRSMERDIQLKNRLKRLWGPSAAPTGNTLGHENSYNDKSPDSLNPIIPWYSSFTNVGDAAMMFIKSTYIVPIQRKYQIIPSDTEQQARFDVNVPSLQNVFKYITAFDPDFSNANEMRVRGRININTAPKFVIEQFPWVSKVNGKDLRIVIADAIVAYRDKTVVNLSPNYSGSSGRHNITGITDIDESPGFRSIGELMNVINQSTKVRCDIRYYGMDGNYQYGYPDLTVDSNDVKDDLEEKELIFARISDLATVRSDVFTAYILVRLGTDGPQKRFIAILDRTGVSKNNGNNRVKIAAFQQTPPAR